MCFDSRSVSYREGFHGRSVDLGQLDRGTELLHRGLEVALQHSHACIVYQKKGDLVQAVAFTSQALAIDPKNPVTSKPGRHSGTGGRRPESSLLPASILPDQSPGPSTGVRASLSPIWRWGDIEPAQKHFQAVLAELRRRCILARKGLREIAVRSLKAGGRGWMRSSICWMPCGGMMHLPQKVSKHTSTHLVFGPRMTITAPVSLWALKVLNFTGIKYYVEVVILYELGELF